METEETAYSKLFDLGGRVALVTGAGVGFEESVCLGFAEYGCNIAASALDIEKPQGTAGKGAEKKSRAIALWPNIAVPGDPSAMVNETVRQLGGMDIVVIVQVFRSMTRRKMLGSKPGYRVIDIKLRGTFLCCQAAVRHMLKNGRGVIINFSLSQVPSE